MQPPTVKRSARLAVKAALQRGDVECSASAYESQKAGTTTEVERPAEHAGPMRPGRFDETSAYEVAAGSLSQGTPMRASARLRAQSERAESVVRQTATSRSLHQGREHRGRVEEQMGTRKEAELTMSDQHLIERHWYRE